jgi:isoamylase
MNPVRRFHALHCYNEPGGWPAPLGAAWVADRQVYNFSLSSRHASGVTLLLYRRSDPVRPVFEYRFDPLLNKTGQVWHCQVTPEQAADAELYAYRVEGPFNLKEGDRFDPYKVLLDPYARGVWFPLGFDRKACGRPGPTDGKAPLGVLPPRTPPGVELFHTPERPLRPCHGHDAIIYELHVRGFTARANSGVSPARRGTFSGLVEKLPYLQELGVTVVELLPVHQYDPAEGNYWGYMTLNFFAPHHLYAAGAGGDGADLFAPLNEFQAMVDAFHTAGIQVWLDVVYNHTSESDQFGPTYTFRGIDNRSYYLLQRDRSRYLDDTGTGNTTRCANPAMRSLVVDSLTHWAGEMGADGFRFDLASIFTRDAAGGINIVDPPLVAEISYMADALDVALVAEAWDIGSNQLGRGFPGVNWLQWNGKFRDDVRAFVRGDPGLSGALALRLYGSDDLFPNTLSEAYRPYQSVNFVTAHDGFCLHDLVAYDVKRNRANGRGNQDGSDHNLSWNCGWEGEAGAPPEVLSLRRRQARNFCALLLLANGLPMFVAGDEFLNTQQGNNNPYNQDNEITWLDWDRLEQNRDFFRFFKLMIAFRKAHPCIGRRSFWREDVRWYGTGPQPDFSPASHTLAYCLHGAQHCDDDLYVMVNNGPQDLVFTVQEGDPGDWLRVVDTALPAPNDIYQPGEEPPLDSLEYRVGSRSVVVLRRELRWTDLPEFERH